MANFISRLIHHHHSDQQPLVQTLPDENAENAGRIRKVVKVGCLVNALLMILKLSVGYFGHSDALFADGFHSLNDVAADLIMLVFVGISYKQADKRYAWGYGKYETFSSFIISAFLIGIALMIMYEGVESLVGYFNGETIERPDFWTLVVVLFAMACKEGLYRFYSHAGKLSASKALLANAWHHRSDAMASVATLIGVGCSFFFGENFRVLDPIASIVIAVFILMPAFRILKPSFLELMDRSLPDSDYSRAEKAIEDVVGKQNLRYLKTRRHGHSYIFDIGADVDGSKSVSDLDQLRRSINQNLEKEFCKHIQVVLTPYPR